MTQHSKPFFDLHVFCCTNQRAENHSRDSCARSGSEQLRDYMKNQVKKLKLEQSIRISTSGCLDRCEEGPVMVLYPEAVWYSYHSKDDIDEIIECHIKHGKVVERLLIDKQS